MNEDEDVTHSKTTLGNALDAGLEITDDIKKLAIEAEKKKHQRLSYKTYEFMSDNWKVFLLFLVTTIGGLITYFAEKLTGG